MSYPGLTVFHKFIKKARLNTSRAVEYFRTDYLATGAAF